MVIPACASTSFSPSNNNLISSALFSGTFPFFGSLQIRPAKYRVSPKTMPALKGAFTNFVGSLIALRAVCPDDWEYAPCTMRIPAIKRMGSTIPIRRFMGKLLRQRSFRFIERRDCRKCSAGSSRLQAEPWKTVQGIHASKMYLERMYLERDPAGVNEEERSQPERSEDTTS